MKKLVLLFVLLYSFASGQSVEIKEIKLHADKKYFNTEEATIVLPIISARSYAASLKMNSYLHNAIIDEEYHALTVDSGLSNMTRDGLISMGYEVTFNEKGILSITIYQEVIRAYLSNWEVFFNFNTETGDIITIDDIIKKEKSGTFYDLVFAKKKEELNKYKVDIERFLSNKEIDKETFEVALETVNNYCIDTVALTQFSLYEEGIRIMDKCQLAHVIQSLSPIYTLNYSYASIAELLNPDWKKKLLR